MSGRRLAAPLALAAALALTLAPAAGATPSWHEVPVAPPPGPDGAPPPFPVPLGAISDIEFWAPNRGLMAVAGNNVVPAGLYSWNGQTWRQYASVCGGSAAQTRIAWAGPTEFWTTAQWRLDRSAGQGDNTSLCRFSAGAVAQSFASAPEDPFPYAAMDAAACAAPSDCWFGGNAITNGTRRGAFHLHWDGSALEEVDGQQGRAISDLAALGGRFYETTFLGPERGTPTAPDLTFPESPPKLLHQLISGNFRNESFTPASLLDPSKAAVELQALQADGARLWVVGGPAASGPSSQTAGTRTGPVLGRLVSGAVIQASLRSGVFSPDDSFFDVAPLPGTDQAWVAVAPYNGAPDLPATESARGRLVRLRDDGTVLEDVTLPAAPATPEGAILHVACATANDCWAGTVDGEVWRWSEPGQSYAPDADPAFNGPVIADRPPDRSIPQFTPDTPPIDDSLRFAPPPPPPPPPTPMPPQAKRYRALLSKLKVSRRGMTIVIRFKLARRARLQFTGRDRRNRVVARTRRARLAPGTHKLTMKARRSRWPRRIRYTFRDLAPPKGLGPDDRALQDSGDGPATF